jgi:hypothetical protein
MKQCCGPGTAGTVTCALAEREPECITFRDPDPVSVPNLDPDTT